jgi:Tfp pilus assembly PilM family ATPase
LLAAFSDRLPGRSRKLLALDWDDNTLKAVEATLQKGALRVSRVISAAIPDTVKIGEPDSFGPFVRQVLADKKFTTRQALLAIPRDKVILINHRLPAAPVGDLSSMVKLQASRELPFSADEAVMDFAGATAHDAPEFIDVTIAAIQRDVMAQYRQFAHAAGLHLVRVGLRPNSNLVAVTRGVQPFADDRILFVDVSPNATEINIFRWGRLTFSRSVSINVNVDAAVPVDDAAGRPILLEVLRTVEAYRASDPTKIDQVVIAGDTGLERWLAETLRTRINAPTSLYDPTWTIAIEKDRAAQMTGFAAVLGLLAGQLAPPIARFDFHTPKRPANVAAIRRKQGTLIGAAAVVLIAGVWLFTSLCLSSLQTQKADLAAANAVLKKQADAADAVGKRIATAQKWIKQDMIWLDKIRDIVDQMPDNRMSYTTKVTAKAASSEVPDARELQMGLRMADWQVPKTLQDSLSKDKRFTVKLGPSRQTPSDPKYGFTGDVTIVIPPEKDKPVPKAAAKPEIAAVPQPAPDTSNQEAAPPDTPQEPQSVTTEPAAPEAPAEEVAQ